MSFQHPIPFRVFDGLMIQVRFFRAPLRPHMLEAYATLARNDEPHVQACAFAVMSTAPVVAVDHTSSLLSGNKKETLPAARSSLTTSLVFAYFVIIIISRQEVGILAFFGITL